MEESALRVRSIFREFSRRLEDFKLSSAVQGDPLTATAQLSTVVEPIADAHRIIDHFLSRQSGQFQLERDSVTQLQSTFLPDGSVQAVGMGWLLSVSADGTESSLSGSRNSSPLVVHQLLESLGYGGKKGAEMARKLL